ncbi:hypothetical protein EDC01DRAFT_776358 [Geopyxis carbonaria]|nr:hypothetical protein EDC01DRAFT_776358 [Geopyxis carbonaria]
MSGSTSPSLRRIAKTQPGASWVAVAKKPAKKRGRVRAPVVATAASTRDQRKRRKRRALDRFGDWEGGVGR